MLSACNMQTAIHLRLCNPFSVYDSHNDFALWGDVTFTLLSINLFINAWINVTYRFSVLHTYISHNCSALCGADCMEILLKTGATQWPTTCFSLVKRNAWLHQLLSRQPDLV